MGDPLIGEVIEDRYRVKEVLGQGGAGTIYLVELVAGNVGSQLALKLIRADLNDSPARQEQFISEIRLAMKIVHEHIVQIRDVGTTADGLLYYTMDYCPGRTLKEILAEEGALSIPRTRAIAYRALMALHAAHRAGVIHRDLKPSNIMVSGDGNSGAGHETIRILDFGIATIVTDDDSAEKIQGTPSYMPPEQFLGEKLGFYTDLYALGVILYECITGRKPYEGHKPREILDRVRSGAVIPPAKFSPEVENYPGLSDALMRAIDGDPAKRFQSAGDFAKVLKSVFASQPSAAPSPQRQRPVSPVSSLGSRPASAGADQPAAAIRRTPRRRPAANAATRRAGPTRSRSGSSLPTKSQNSPVGIVIGAVAVVAIGILAVVMMQGPSTSETPNRRVVDAPTTPPSKTRKKKPQKKTPPADSAKSLWQQASAEFRDGRRYYAMIAKASDVEKAAHQSLASKHLTAARDFLKRAEELDPDWSAVKDLKREVVGLLQIVQKDKGFGLASRHGAEPRRRKPTTPDDLFPDRPEEEPEEVVTLPPTEEPPRSTPKRTKGSKRRSSKNENDPEDAVASNTGGGTNDGAIADNSPGGDAADGDAADGDAEMGGATEGEPFAGIGKYAKSLRQTIKADDGEALEVKASLILDPIRYRLALAIDELLKRRLRGDALEKALKDQFKSIRRDKGKAIVHVKFDIDKGKRIYFLRGKIKDLVNLHRGRKTSFTMRDARNEPRPEKWMAWDYAGNAGRLNRNFIMLPLHGRSREFEFSAVFKDRGNSDDAVSLVLRGIMSQLEPSRRYSSLYSTYDRNHRNSINVSQKQLSYISYDDLRVPDLRFDFSTAQGEPAPTPVGFEELLERLGGK